MSSPSDALLPESIASIGGGQMAEAILRGLIASGLAPGAALVADPDPKRREFLAKELGVRTTADNREAARNAEVVLLAVKPGQLEAATAGLLDVAQPLYLSILAGRSLHDLEAAVGPRVARAMPNTPALVRAGVSALAPHPSLSPAETDRLAAILSAVGQVVSVPEAALDAVTGLSGSGPAYVYLVIEALTDAGIREGLPAATAKLLASETVAGAAKMVRDTGEHPAVLRQKVMSPGGTTAAGVAALEQAGLRSALLAAVSAATRRSRELASS